MAYNVIINNRFVKIPAFYKCATWNLLPWSMRMEAQNHVSFRSSTENVLDKQIQKGSLELATMYLVVRNSIYSILIKFDPIWTKKELTITHFRWYKYNKIKQNQDTEMSVQIAISLIHTY